MAFMSLGPVYPISESRICWSVIPVVRLTNLCSLSSLMRSLQSLGLRYPNQLIRTDTIFVTTLSMESDIMNVAEQLRNNENW